MPNRKKKMPPEAGLRQGSEATSIEVFHQNRKGNPMLKNLPKKEVWHEYRYKQLLRQYGTNKSGVAIVNAIFLDELGVENTPKTRDLLRTRMKAAKKEIGADSEIFRGEAKQEKDTLALKVDAFIEILENSDISEPSYRDVATLLRVRLDLAIHEAKLFGLYQEGTKQDESSRDTQPTVDTSRPETDGDDDLERQIKTLEKWAEGLDEG